MGDIFLFLDTLWEYDYIVDYVNYVVQRLNVRPFGSSITLLAARDGSVIVNRTFYVSEYYGSWNRTSHSWFKTGFNLPSALAKAQLLAETIMQEERNAHSLGGRSMIALLLPSPTAFVSDYDYEYCQRFMAYFNNSLPSLTFLYYAGGAVIRFKDFVNNAREDLFALSYELEPKAAGEPLVNRIRKVVRRLSNPRCSAHWHALSSGPNQIMQYTGLDHINFYHLTPHYYFNEGSMRFLKVQALSPIVFTVCTSRSNAWPYRHPSEPFAKGVDCRQVTAADISFDLGELCAGYDTLDACPPWYLSVQSQAFAPGNQLICKGAACSSPDESQFLIKINNLDCTNAASGQQFPTTTFFLVMALVFKIFFYQ